LRREPNPAIALAMLENGAGGVTRAQISVVLGADAISFSRQDQGWAQLLSGADCRRPT
jgi:hypothetical protein